MTKEQKKSAEVQKREPTLAERFSLAVQREFKGKAGVPVLTESQKRLIQNYFIATDIALKKAEERRQKKTGKYQEKLPVTWQNVVMDELAIKVVAYSRLGLDPAMPNHINMVPYKNNTTEKYDIVLIEGYRGKEIKATKYGLDVPDFTVIKVVYSNEKLIPIWKDSDHPVESYSLIPAPNPFDRGEIVGGFYYRMYTEDPYKNELVIMNKAEIEKRKPKYASAEFWGGDVPVYETDQETGKSKKVGTEHIEGWYEKMVYKTLCRAAYEVTIDSQKIDDNFREIQRIEMEASKMLPESEVTEKANTEDIDFEDVTGKGEEKKTYQQPGAPEQPGQTEAEEQTTEQTQPAAPEQQPEAAPDKNSGAQAGQLEFGGQRKGPNF